MSSFLPCVPYLQLVLVIASIALACAAVPIWRKQQTAYLDRVWNRVVNPVQHQSKTGLLSLGSLLALTCAIILGKCHPIPIMEVGLTWPVASSVASIASTLTVALFCQGVKEHFENSMLTRASWLLQQKSQVQGSAANAEKE